MKLQLNEQGKSKRFRKMTKDQADNLITLAERLFNLMKNHTLHTHNPAWKSKLKITLKSISEYNDNAE